MSGGIADRLEIVDPGLVRTRRGVRAVCATVLAWATMVAVTSAFEVVDPIRITLFAAGAAFEGALLAPDPQPKDRLRTLGWASAVAAVAVVVTVGLARTTPWAAMVLLVLLIFSSYAVRSWSPRVASLALMGAITVYVTGGGYITVGRIRWFVLALVVGFGWLALWEALLLPDHPVQSLRRSVHAFAQRAADTAAGAVNVLNTARDGTPCTPAAKDRRRRIERARRCRSAIERQFPGAAVQGVSQHDIDALRVALYSAQRGLEDLVRQAQAPGWMQLLPDQIAASITSTLQALAAALRDDGDENAREVAVRRAQVLRAHIHEALIDTAETGAAQVPPETLLAALTLLDAGATVAQSVERATTLVDDAPIDEPTAIGTSDGGAPPAQADTGGLSPTMALAIQAAVAAVTAGLIATMVGNEQRLVVAWTAFVVIGGSAGLSTRRALVRVPATIVGAVGGVAIAALVPDTVPWTVAVVAVGVFFAIVSAPVSYPAMVFWMSIVFVPLFATEGRYLDLIRDKTVAAFIGGCVAAVVALWIVPLRSSREIRPAVLEYLACLDDSLESHLTGRHDRIATTETELDRAHAKLASKIASAATEISVFAQSQNTDHPEAAHIDALHDAYLRLSPLLSHQSRLLHGWTDDHVHQGIGRLRDAVAKATAAARGEEASVTVDGSGTQVPATIATDAETLELADSRRRVAEVEALLDKLTAALRTGSPVKPSQPLMN